MTVIDWDEPFPRYTDEQIATIVLRSSISDVLRDEGIELAPSGDGLLNGACPFCSRPTFQAHVKLGSFTCFSCAEGGRNVVVLACKLRDLYYMDAVAWLDERSAGGGTR